jgi:hypothetical protein
VLLAANGLVRPGRSPQGARSAWTYRQLAPGRRTLPHSYRPQKGQASIGPNGQASEAISPAARGRHGRARQAEPILAQRAPGRHTAPDAAVAIEGARRRSARMSLLGNRAVPVILGLLRIMAQRCKTEPRPRRGRREDRSLADGRFAQQR